MRDGAEPLKVIHDVYLDCEIAVTQFLTGHQHRRRPPTEKAPRAFGCCIQSRVRSLATLKHFLKDVPVHEQMDGTVEAPSVQLMC